jgi:hypothetical protein
MSDEKKDFVVKDRRAFSDERPEDEAQDKENATASSTDDELQAASDSEKVQEADAKESAPPEGIDEAPLPQINFATFVVSLNASALMNLGAIEDPSTGQTNKNLAMAKQTIDILSMLEEKTAGNLTTDESNLIKNILYDLRIIYVKESG